MKHTRFSLFAAVLIAASLPACFSHAQKITIDPGGPDALGYSGRAVISGVNIETAQTLDVLFPGNGSFKINRIEGVVRTAPSAVTTKGRVQVATWNGTTATEHRGSVALASVSTAAADVIYAPGNVSSGYVFYQNVVAAGTTGLVTQVVNLTTPAAATVIAQPDIPRKLVLTLSDAAGGNLAGTVTFVGTSVEGDSFTEVVTVAAGTVSYTTANAFAKLTSVAHNFGALGAASDTLDVGQATAMALPARYVELVKLVSNAVEEAASAVDVPAGTITATTAPNATNDYEIWYRVSGTGVVVTGGQSLRLVVTASTVTGDDVRDFVIHFTRL